MAGGRWTPEQLAEQISKRDNVVAIAAGASKRATTVAKGLRLSNERLEGSAEYLFQVRTAGLPMPEFEFRFHDTRRWRADYAWPAHMLLAEYEGGTFTEGRHTRGKGFENDCEKYNEATIMGYRVLRFTHRMVITGMALNMTEQALTK